MCPKRKLWFAEKFVSLLIEQHRAKRTWPSSCVVICWKIRIFAYWTTPVVGQRVRQRALWFAEKFVSLLIEQHLNGRYSLLGYCCDLLKNSYLCLLNNTELSELFRTFFVVICWKIRIFAYWTTPENGQEENHEKLWFAEKFVSLLIEQHPELSELSLSFRCDLLKNSYLCLLNNTPNLFPNFRTFVVICWKIRIFAYWTTPFRT